MKLAVDLFVLWQLTEYGMLNIFVQRQSEQPLVGGGERGGGYVRDTGPVLWSAIGGDQSGPQTHSFVSNESGPLFVHQMPSTNPVPASAYVSEDLYEGR